MDPIQDDSQAAEQPMSRWSVGRLAVGVVVLGAVAASGWYVYDRVAGSDGGAAPVPLIEADDGPTKKRPDDPGGLTIPNQDKLIYEALDGDGAEETVERLLPPPEEPLPQPEPPAPPAPEVEAEPPAPEPTIDAVTGQSSVPALPPAELHDEAAVPPVDTPVETEVKTATIPPPPEPEPEATPEPVAEPETVKPGVYLIQVAAFRKIDDADAAWRRLAKNNVDLLSHLTARVERTDLGAELGVFYRLRFGPLADEAAAKALCGSLKARDIDCLVVGP